jgi:hypothetical protein
MTVFGVTLIAFVASFGAVILINGSSDSWEAN